MPQTKRRPTGEPEAARRLQQIPNVGPAIAQDLMRLGISRLEDLAGREPDELYEALCQRDGVRHDPCMHDVFTAIVAYARGEPARPWWAYSAARKARANPPGDTIR